MYSTRAIENIINQCIIDHDGGVTFNKKYRMIHLRSTLLLFMLLPTTASGEARITQHQGKLHKTIFG